MALDEIDLRILRILEKNSKTSLNDIGKGVGIFSASAISRRIRGMEEAGLIKKYSVELDHHKLGLDFITVTFVKAKYQIRYMDKVANKIENIPGVVSVYFLLGDIDFVLITISRNKADYEETLNRLTEVTEIERTDSRTVLRTFKEGDYSNTLLTLIKNLRMNV